jgi:hypothetical protein
MEDPLDALLERAGPVDAERERGLSASRAERQHIEDSLGVLTASMRIALDDDRVARPLGGVAQTATDDAPARIPAPQTVDHDLDNSRPQVPPTQMRQLVHDDRARAVDAERRNQLERPVENRPAQPGDERRRRTGTDEDLRGVDAHTARGLLDELKAAQGAVVNVTSIAGSRVHPFAGAAYSTSKAALAALTREMASDFGPLGVRVNAIAPGEIDTAILSPGTEDIVFVDGFEEI